MGSVSSALSRRATETAPESIDQFIGAEVSAGRRQLSIKRPDSFYIS
jgi:hypothetical protein